jgi:hypothetical protein
MEDDASGPFEFSNFTCFSMRIFFELWVFFNIAKTIGAIIPVV